MKSARSPRSPDPVVGRRAFTLVEVLASLLMMAIIIPVAMEGMGIASRAGILGQRKVAALRIAERVIQETIIEAQTQQSTSSGVTAEGDRSYPWNLRIENWPEDAMQQLTVTVTFTVQGNPYEVSLTTLLPVTSADLEAMADTPATSQ